MHNEDEDFEKFMRRFHLREARPLPENRGGRLRLQALRPSQWAPSRWVLAAAAVVLIAVLPLTLFRYFKTPAGPYATVEAAGDSAYRAGERIPAGRAIHSGANDGIVLSLENGSRIEMRSQSELLLESAAGGVRARLNRGGIIVNAGHVPAIQTVETSVQTKDVESATGQVFVVDAEPAGTRIAALQGEVRIQEGSVLKKLQPGEQLGTNSVAARPLVEGLAWSRNAATYLAMVPQPAAPQPQPELLAQNGIQPIRPQPIVVDRIQPPAPTVVAPIQTPAIVGTPGDPGIGQSLPAGARGPKKSWQTGSPDNPVPRQRAAVPNISGPGGEIFERACTACHSAAVGSSSRYQTRNDYAALISRKRSMGANISDEEVPILLDFLADQMGRRK